MTTMRGRAPRVMGERGIEGKRKEMNERVSHKEPAKIKKIKAKNKSNQWLSQVYSTAKRNEWWFLMGLDPQCFCHPNKNISFFFWSTQKRSRSVFDSHPNPCIDLCNKSCKAVLGRQTKNSAFSQIPASLSALLSLRDSP